MRKGGSIDVTVHERPRSRIKRLFSKHKQVSANNKKEALAVSKALRSDTAYSSSGTLFADVAPKPIAAPVTEAADPDEHLFDLSKDREQLAKQFEELKFYLIAKVVSTVHGTLLFLRITKRVGKKTTKLHPAFGAFAVSLVVITMLLIGVAPRLIHSHSKAAQKPKSIAETIPSVKGASRTILFPSQLPAQFKVEDTPASTVQNDKVSAYTITNGKVNIVATQQDDMPQAAFDSLFKNNQQKVDTPLGSAYLTLAKDQSTALAGIRLDDGRALLLRSSSPIDKSVFILILLTLQPKQ